MRLRHGWGLLCAAAVVTFATGVPAAAHTEPTDDTPTTTVAEEPAEESSDPPAQEVGTSTTDPVADPVADQVIEQDTDAESVQVALANTGGNTSEGNTPSTGSGEPGSNVDTGSAAAVGSSDSTGITQEAITDIGDWATGEVIQISIVFNIGGAIANSGDNTVATGDGAEGDGSISTGSAVAIGNDSQTYVTQGASGDAGPGESDLIEQRTTTLRIGLSIANTGSNTINAIVISTGPGSVTSGDATAIGNQSTTSIEQRASVWGRGTATLRIEQWATVVNLGLAIADSGFNDIGSALGAAVMSGDAEALDALLAALVPALFASVGGASGPGGGDISTGDALAIGNRSTTQVKQVALGSADSGDVTIRQEVLVVNAGIAAATTGNNSIGGGPASPLAALSADEQRAVAELSGFLRGFLADITSWTSGAGTEVGPSSLSAVFGDLNIGIQGSLVGNRSGGLATPGSVTVRQLAAVINLGVARSNTGRNLTVTTTGAPTIVASEGAAPIALETNAVESESPGEALVATISDPIEITGPDGSTQAFAVLVDSPSGAFAIITGNASATNSGVTIICQRANLDELECLRPPVPEQSPEPPPVKTVVVADDPTPQPTATNPSVVAPSPEVAPPPPVKVLTLPLTGSDPAVLVLVGVCMLLLGGGLLLVASRRPAR